jgi:diguanylate cyclase (GGDEF)-like protein/PAS domain S-box-containing protein
MHQLLQRQLRKAGLQPDEPPIDVAAWERLLTRVTQSYAQQDQERYLLERSLLLSSDEMQELSAKLTAERDHLRMIVGSISDGLCALDDSGKLSLVNTTAAVHLGWREDELVGSEILGRIGLGDLPYAALLAVGAPYQVEEAEFLRQDGSTIPVSFTLSPLGHGRGALLIFRDITERRRRQQVRLQLTEEQSGRALAEAAHQAAQSEIVERKRAESALAFQATHDALTGLPNRTLLYDRLEQAIRHAARVGGPTSLLVMDLDRFKEINDTLGHQAGDTLLQRVAQRLIESVRKSDTVARLGGDEFAVLLPGTGSQDAIRVADALIVRLQHDVELGEQLVDVGVSIGIACYPEHGNDSNTLLRQADVAMYAAKRGGSGARVYEIEQDANSRDRLGLVRELREGIQRGELVLHYQPTIEFSTGRVTGVEALVRWAHPHRGLIQPDVFIPIAEQTGLIVPLTAWVLTEALTQTHAWLARGLQLTVSVNLSARSLQDRSLPEMIGAALAASEVDACWLKLEITESMLMADPIRAQEVLGRLRAMGLQIAIDDFGTGYSSLAYLKHLPIDILKIDRSFIKDMASSPQDAAIVRSAIELAHNLGLSVVAEGVETGPIGALLAGLGCDIAQGYHFSRPLAASDFATWLAERDAAAEHTTLAA